MKLTMTEISREVMSYLSPSLGQVEKDAPLCMDESESSVIKRLVLWNTINGKLYN